MRHSRSARSVSIDAPSGSAPIAGKRSLTAQLSGGTASRRGPAPVSSGSGAPLDDGVAARAGAALGHDFSNVRVHQDGQADALGTRAFARGDDVHFASGSYQPGSAGGLSLIGHELAHVAQQRDGHVAATGSIGGQAVNTDPALEAAADAGGAQVAQGFDLDRFLDYRPGRPGSVGAAVVQGEELAADAGTAEAAAPAPTGSRVVDGDGGYRYEQFASGDIEVLAGPARVGETYPVGDPVNDAITREIERIHGAFVADPAPAGDAAGDSGGEAGGDAGDDGGAAADDGSLLPSLDTILTKVGEVGSAVVDTVSGAVDAGAALVDELTGLVFSTLGLGGGAAAGDTPAADAPAADAPAADAPAPVESDTSVDANLAAAKQLADQLSIPHAYDHDGQGSNGANETIIVDDLQAGDRRDAIIAGDAGQLDTILCSEFTNLTLASAGVDLSQRYLVPGDRLPIGYPENKSVTFLTLYMVTNNQRETTASLIDHQNGSSERVTAGSERATELGCPDEATDFFVTAKGDIVGMEVTADNEFGAGATAVSLGGKEVDPADRKPGDLQQALAVDANGIASGAGHSSQVWAVRGHGVACLGQPGSPKIVGGTVSQPGPIDTLSGWYELPPGKLMWELVPETDPAQVASFTCVDFQLIDANTGRANDDATGIGGSRKDKSSEIVSNGRLPDSKWFDWSARDVATDGELS